MMVVMVVLVMILITEKRYSWQELAEKEKVLLIFANSQSWRAMYDDKLIQHGWVPGVDGTYTSTMHTHATMHTRVIVNNREIVI